MQISKVFWNGQYQIVFSFTYSLVMAKWNSTLFHPLNPILQNRLPQSVVSSDQIALQNSTIHLTLMISDFPPIQLIILSNAYGWDPWVGTRMNHELGQALKQPAPDRGQHQGMEPK